ncbi:DUF7573 domain-containing protein [Halogeometricum limi]|uniref:DUF7573 domain-containing protein n=1 Tax=Halogeometricum limi TaxID=555875 RepID=UPI000B7F9584|nr:hypothetical protein [Halogeometricum limi]
MTTDRSLDEFLAGDDSDEADETDETPDSDDGAETELADTDEEEPVTDEEESLSDEETPAIERDTATEPVDPETVAPAVGTYRFDPDGVDCPRCGETVDRLWLDDDEQVCKDCKDW